MRNALHIDVGEILNNKEDVMKRSFLICALFLGAWAVRPGISHGQTLSPAGSWQVTILGSDKGTAVMTFSNNFTVSGYGITRKQFGLFTLTGNWAFNNKGDVVVAYIQSLNSVGTAFNFTAHLLRSGKFRAKGTDTAHARFRFKGEQPADVPDLSGAWTSVVHRHGKTLHELYTVTASTNFPAVFDVTGQGLSDTGSFTLDGAIIATSHNKLNASIDRTSGVDTQRSSLFGTFKPARSEMRLAGVDDTHAHLSVKAAQTP
jgi:hypothetical protein